MSLVAGRLRRIPFHWGLIVSIALGVSLLACRVPPSDADLSTYASKKDVGGPALVEVMVDRIAYVNGTGDLFSVDPDGGNLINLTGGARVGAGPQGAVMAQRFDFDSFYFWPTWSPDGTRLAASRIDTSGDGPTVTVEVLDPAGGTPRAIFRNEVPSLVAQGAPHYLYWSPDSRHLTLLASTPQAFALLLVDTEDSGAPVVLETGAPLYLHWGAGGVKLVLHAGDAVKLVENPGHAFSSDTLADVGQGFRTPAFDPSGRLIAYSVLGDASTGGNNPSLLVRETGSAHGASSILEVGLPNSFAWAPAGREIAVLDRQSSMSPAFDRLRVLMADGSGVRILAEEAIIAFFWSPSGEQIAWVAFEQEQQVFKWKVSRVDGSGQRELFTYRPSQNSLTMLSFFDQYAYSHSPWSPDGSRLVVSGTQVEPFARRNGNTPTGERIYILDAASDRQARELAQGTLAVWSWN